ncbi:MAG: hypothetical protein B6242_03600 [Anaerolineaceae bacterium 4572_78]|nr:MAG: hypothetical protein B6242_03600 [Anaerolineaceae bacterium 4572_78]
MSVVIGVVIVVLNIISYVVIARVVISWLPIIGFQVSPDNPIIRIVFDITDPIIEPIRPYTTFGMLDLSPIIILFGIFFIIDFLSRM